jgi:hypothetical protein
MSNIPAERQNTSPAIAALEALEIFADSVAGPDGQLVKFVRGNWTTGQDNETIDTDARFVAVLSGLRHGYIRWEDGQPVGRCMALVADHPIALARGELGDMDEQYWPRRDGEPVDPWSFCYELPLIDAESEGARLFSTSSVGGRQCIGKLARTYAQHTRKHAGELPIVTLASETYRHESYGTIAKPTMKITGWTRDPDWSPPAEPSASPAGSSHVLDDQIPFAPEWR